VRTERLERHRHLLGRRRTRSQSYLIGW
jgi:hypothetical protein